MIATLVTLLAMSPAAAQDCDDVSILLSSANPNDQASDAVDITGDEDFVGITQHVYLEAQYAEGAGAGCDLSECTWLIDNWGSTKGGFASCDAPGSPTSRAMGDTVCYYAPSDLEDCLDIQVELAVDCSDQGVGVWADKPQSLLTVGPVPTDDNSGTRPTFERCSVSGGGCISPQSSGASSAWVLLPLLGLGGLARRRED